MRSSVPAVTVLALIIGVLGCSATRRPFVKPKIRFEKAAPALLSNYRVPGAVFAQIEGGEVVAVEALGYADLDSRTPMTANTVLQVGSVSKSVAAWMFLKLVQEDRLDLDTPLTYYLRPWPLPASPDSGWLTLRHILVGLLAPDITEALGVSDHPVVLAANHSEIAPAPA